MARHRMTPGKEAHDVLAAEEFGVPAPDRELHERNTEAHDVLAAEEFALPAPDPDLRRRGEDEARDVLAAEEFAVPAPDPHLGHAVVLPPDPTGIEEPHDVLAAEEFAVPAPPAHAASDWSPLSVSRRPARPPLPLLGTGVGLAVLALIRHRRSR